MDSHSYLSDMFWCVCGLSDVCLLIQLIKYLTYSKSPLGLYRALNAVNGLNDFALPNPSKYFQAPMRQALTISYALHAGP